MTVNYDECDLPVREGQVGSKLLFITVYPAINGAVDVLLWRMTTTREKGVELGSCVMSGRYRNKRWLSVVGEPKDKLLVEIGEWLTREGL